MTICRNVSAIFSGAVRNGRSLSFRLLLWDFSVLYLLARELPTLALQ